ncbi:MAG: hypothetical protein MJY56_04525 [Bacteroidales bacterium]|nr:hypothetical protein [Bacteroidales bacterium]
MNFRRYFITALAALMLLACGKPAPAPDQGTDTPEAPETPEYPYEITSTEKISGISVLLKDKHLDDLIPYAEEYLGEMARKPVLAINYEYPSVGPDGKEVTLSARLYILEMLYGLGKAPIGMVLANHASIVEAGQCPTRSLNEEAMLAWAGAAVVMPDYYGFGASEDKPQAYLNSRVTAKGSIDAFKTARQILRKRGLILTCDNYNLGYSQGGFNTIANLKYISENPDDAVKFAYSFAGAGSYDLGASFDEYFKDTYPAAAIFIPLTIIATNECEGLGLDYSKIFREPLLSGYKEWILSKKYSYGTIMRNIGTDKLAGILTEEAFDGTSEEIRTLREVLEGYSVSSGWKPKTGTKILLYHSTEDDVVPSVNSDILYDYLTSIGADVKLVKGADGGHTEAEMGYLQAILDVINEEINLQ